MTQQKWPSDLRVVRVPNIEFPDLATYQLMGAYIDEGGAEHPDQQCVWAETDNDPETARLIAAAPELLAALKEIAASSDAIAHAAPGALCGVLGGLNLHRADVAARAQAATAIAKAEEGL